MDTEDHSLVTHFESSFGLPYPFFPIVVALALGLLLGLAAFAQGQFAHGVDWGLWPLGLNPAVIVYIFLVFPLMHSRWQQAMRSLCNLAPQADISGTFNGISHRGEWIALLVGAIIGLLVGSQIKGAGGWLYGYSVVTNIVAFALMGSVIYRGLARTRRLAACARTGLELDVFDGHLLTPFARWGQSVSLAFLGGISLSLLFQTYDSLHSIYGIAIYAVLIGVALTLFFTSVWSIHVALVRAQSKELARVRADLAAARRALRQRWAGDPTRAATDDYLPVVVCGLYERQVLEASTWPFNPQIVRQLLASAAAPVCVYVVKLASGLAEGL